MAKIPQRKILDESEFTIIGNIVEAYSIHLVTFPIKSKEEQTKFLAEFGKDMNTLLIALYEWIHKDD